MKTAKDLTIIEKFAIESSNLCALISLLYDGDKLPYDLRVAIIDIMSRLEELRIDSLLLLREQEQ